MMQQPGRSSLSSLSAVVPSTFRSKEQSKSSGDSLLLKSRLFPFRTVKLLSRAVGPCICVTLVRGFSVRCFRLVARLCWPTAAATPLDITWSDTNNSSNRSLSCPISWPAMRPTDGAQEEASSSSASFGQAGSSSPSDLFAMAPPLMPDERDDDDDRSILSLSDIDSALGDICDLSTASLRSSIVRAREENGRQYHGYKEGRYVLPTDAPELDRQDFQYELCLATFDNRLHLAPINRPHRVLDAGCGLGRWAIDFAEEHPESQVVGIDLAPVQPLYTLPNVSFEIDDLEEEWSFSSNFDYIHVMMMTGAFRDWPRFIRQSFNTLNVGAWLEIQDIDFPIECDDGSITSDSYLRRWSDLMMEAADKSGFLLNTCGRAAAMMEEAGFVDIMRVPFKWPINRWPTGRKHKQLGGWTEVNFCVGMEAMSLALFTRFLGWSREQVMEFVPAVISEWRDTRKHGYFNLYITYGRRP